MLVSRCCQDWLECFSPGISLAIADVEAQGPSGPGRVMPSTLAGGNVRPCTLRSIMLMLHLDGGTSYQVQSGAQALLGRADMR